jgi:predicted nucleic acid-binding protein
MRRALLDLNVVLDVLFARAPHVREASVVFARVETGEIEGYVAAHTITTLHYLAAKRHGRTKCRELILDVLKLFDVVAVDEELLRRALEMNWKDFEDAVQAACAEAVEAHYLVTRDKKGFRAARVDVFTPGELVALLQS